MGVYIEYMIKKLKRAQRYLKDLNAIYVTVNALEAPNTIAETLRDIIDAVAKEIATGDEYDAADLLAHVTDIAYNVKVNEGARAVLEKQVDALRRKIWRGEIIH